MAELPLETAGYYIMQLEPKECFSYLAMRYLLWGELSCCAVPSVRTSPTRGVQTGMSQVPI